MKRIYRVHITGPTLLAKLATVLLLTTVVKSQYYANSSSKKTCSSNCRTCSTYSGCVTCESGYWKKNSYNTFTGDYCLKCPRDCRSCYNGSGKCYSCNQGYTSDVSSGTCKADTGSIIAVAYFSVAFVVICFLHIVKAKKRKRNRLNRKTTKVNLKPNNQKRPPIMKPYKPPKPKPAPRRNLPVHPAQKAMPYRPPPPLPAQHYAPPDPLPGNYHQLSANPLCPPMTNNMHPQQYYQQPVVHQVVQPVVVQPVAIQHVNVVPVVPVAQPQQVMMVNQNQMR